MVCQVSLGRRAIPTAARLQEGLQLNKAQATRLRQLLKGEIDPREFSDVQAWLKRCHGHQPSDAELKMCAANELLETYGVEAIWPKGFAWAPTHVYCNNGRTYHPTLMHNVARGSFYIGCWGDAVR